MATLGPPAGLLAHRPDGNGKRVVQGPVVCQRSNTEPAGVGVASTKAKAATHRECLLLAVADGCAEQQAREQAQEKKRAHITKGVVNLMESRRPHGFGTTAH